MADILDVARLAGVSKSTVSRVLTSSGYVKAATREKILKAMDKLEYSPSYFAQAIRTGKAKTIAILYPDSSNIFYNELFSAVEDKAFDSGYMVLTCNTRQDKARELMYLKELVKRNVDGVIFCTYFADDEHRQKLLDASNEIPMVFMDHLFNSADKVSMVVTEDIDSNSQVVKYLAGKGAKRVAYLWLSDVTVLGSRYQGYLTGLERAGLQIDDQLVYKARYEDSFKQKTHINLGYEGMKSLMGLKNPPDAVMASTDILAIGAIQYLQENGISVPEEIRVIGYDNIWMSQLIKPTLTTISQPIRSLGNEAVRILLNKIRNGNQYNQNVVMVPELIIRESA